MRLTTQTTSSSVSTEPPILPSKYWSWLIQAPKPQLQVYTIPRSAVMSLLLPWHVQAKTWKLKPTQRASCQWRPTSTNTHGEDTEPKQRVSSSKCRVTPQCCPLIHLHPHTKLSMPDSSDRAETMLSSAESSKASSTSAPPAPSSKVAWAQDSQDTVWNPLGWQPRLPAAAFHLLKTYFCFSIHKWFWPQRQPLQEGPLTPSEPQSLWQLNVTSTLQQTPFFWF